MSLQIGLLLADTKYRGEFEEKMKNIMDEVKEAGDIILFIDEVHMVVGAGGTGEDGGLDAGNLMKPALARVSCSASELTTIDEYRKHIEKDAALERRFQPVRVVEPSPEQSLTILRGLKETYQEHHGVSFRMTPCAPPCRSPRGTSTIDSCRIRRSMSSTRPVRSCN